MGHPCKFQRLSRLGSLAARQSSSERQPNFAALNRGRHLCSAGRPCTLGIGPHSSLQLVCKHWLVPFVICLHGVQQSRDAVWNGGSTEHVLHHENLDHVTGRGTFGGLVCSAKFPQNLAFFQKIRREILRFSREICCALSMTRQTVYAKFLCNQPIYLAKTASSMYHNVTTNLLSYYCVTFV